jgi:hypothetical protein
MQFLKAEKVPRQIGAPTLFLANALFSFDDIARENAARHADQFFYSSLLGRSFFILSE